MLSPESRSRQEGITHSPLFASRAEVIFALKRYRDMFDPRSGSIIALSRNGYDPEAEPFRVGFLNGIEVRGELLHRMMTRLGPRERLLLLLWYVADLPPGKVARRVGVSRVHCYRLRNQALEALADQPPQDESETSVPPLTTALSRRHTRA